METTIGEIVAKDYRKADVFKKYGLDFCCGGKKELAKACEAKGIDLKEIEKELNAIDQWQGSPSQNFYNWNIDFLADYIVNTHHKYVLQSIPILVQYTQKVAKVHGDNHPEVIKIADHFMSIIDELNRHMMKEENVLFPYIKKLADAKSKNLRIDPAGFGEIKNPIHVMELEHEVVGNLMKEIKELSNNYTVPPDACTTYRISFTKLKEFEEDLHQHIHLENNILFPKAFELESELLAKK